MKNHVLGPTIRLARAGDLRELEWDGMFSAHREIILRAYARQLAGTNVMLVAEAGDALVGQIWIDLEKPGIGAPLLWALRVHPSSQGCGIGTALLSAAEEWLRAEGHRQVAIGVERSNPEALRLYLGTGFEVCGPLREKYSYVTPEGARLEHELDEWLLLKRLDPAPVRTTEAGP